MIRAAIYAMTILVIMCLSSCNYLNNKQPEFNPDRYIKQYDDSTVLYSQYQPNGDLHVGHSNHFKLILSNQGVVRSLVIQDGAYERAYDFAEDLNFLRFGGMHNGKSIGWSKFFDGKGNLEREFYSSSADEDNGVSQFKYYKDGKLIEDSSRFVVCESAAESVIINLKGGLESESIRLVLLDKDYNVLETYDNATRTMIFKVSFLEDASVCHGLFQIYSPSVSAKAGSPKFFTTYFDLQPVLNKDKN
jgi:hypothetical protein